MKKQGSQIGNVRQRRRDGQVEKFLLTRERVHFFKDGLNTHSVSYSPDLRHFILVLPSSEPRSSSFR